jgi:YidC/Oxa1 family membrane protein insertase
MSGLAARLQAMQEQQAEMQRKREEMERRKKK